MKRVDLIATIEPAGCELLRNGARHDIYHTSALAGANPFSAKGEINEHLARRIIPGLTEE